MWFRVETYKDGSIKSCEQVAESFNDSAHVFYIEAPTKEKALSKVGRFLEARRREYARVAERRAKRLKRHTCIDCGAPVVGRKHRWLKRKVIYPSRCEEHEAKQKEFNRKRTERERDGITRVRPRRTATQRLIMCQYARASRRKRWRKEILQSVLDKLDKDPVGFRTWLEDQLLAVRDDLARMKIAAMEKAKINMDDKQAAE